MMTRIPDCQARDEKGLLQKRSVKTSIVRLLPWIWLAACFMALCSYVHMNSHTLLDADMASELVLSKMIVDEGRLIFTPNWFYSTEIRFINTQLIYSLFFRFFDSWAVVRMASSVTLYLLYLACFYFLCCKAKIKDSFPIAAGCLLLPVSETYLYIVLFGLFYIPWICMGFLILGLVLEMQSNSQKGKAARALTFVLCVLLSFLAGASGPRLIMVMFLPLLCVAVLRIVKHIYRVGFDFHIPSQDLERERYVKSIRLCVAAAVSFVAAVGGLLFNSFVLAKAYSFASYGSLKWWFLSADRTTYIIYSWMNALGYSAGLELFRKATITNVLACLIAVFSVFILVDLLKRKGKEIGEEHRTVAEFYLLAVLSLTAVLLLTDIDFVSWHLVPVMVFLFPVVAIYLTNCRKKGTKAALSVIVLCSLLCQSSWYYLSFAENRTLTQRTNPDYPQVAAFLQENDYDDGYATFWNGNVMTELTNGEIEMWCVNGLAGDFRAEESIYQWLQAKDHMEKMPTGKTFLLMSSSEYQSVSEQLPDYVGERVYMTDHFVICDLEE